MSDKLISAVEKLAEEKLKAKYEVLHTAAKDLVKHADKAPTFATRHDYRLWVKPLKEALEKLLEH